ncbi:hypothetical protein GIB67_006430 [Kingdonia uniflora]|uniref:Diacylglycerol O-acyltransferase n=1 Tax=Kingdonia uniflora TaxID=39325 RepID=A0A7J7P1I6_9MAGN|nr:hypothetical protein GIB67_006430 [Kingdonia uniflora]
MTSLEGFKSGNKALKPIVTTKTSKVEESTSKEEEEEEPLSPASRLFHEPSYNCYIIVTMRFKEKIDVDVFKSGIEKSLATHPRFSSLHVMDTTKHGEMKLVQTVVDIENHFYVPHLDPNMNTPDQFVEDYISNLSKTTINMSKPLWELHILNIKTMESEAVVVFRIHHSLGDGPSVISLLLSCCRKISNPEAVPTVATRKRLVSMTMINSNIFLWWFLKIYAIFRLVWNTIVDISICTAVSVYLKDVHTPLKGPPGVEFRPRRFVHRTVSMDDIKLVKSATNSTINDVVVGVATAGLSRYLNRIYGKNTIEEEKNNLPKNIWITASIPVNLRGSAEIQDLTEMMENRIQKIKLSNKIGSILFPFAIALRHNPLDYIWDAKATIDRKKQSLGAKYLFFFSNLIAKIFGYKVATALFNRGLLHISAIFSNIAGPLEEISMFGNPVESIGVSVYGLAEAFTLHFHSYAKKMTMVLSVDEDTIPDPHHLCDDLEESLRLIKDAAIASRIMRN